MKHLLALIFALAIGTPAGAEPVTPATFDAALLAQAAALVKIDAARVILEG